MKGSNSSTFGQLIKHRVHICQKTTTIVFYAPYSHANTSAKAPSSSFSIFRISAMISAEGLGASYL